MQSPQFILGLAPKLVAVLFAGGGGSCTGIEKAIGRHVDIAANHSENAIQCHMANHPQADHHIEDVWQLDPRKLADGRPVGYLHASPDCTHFSQAKGGQPRDRATRSLSWVVPKWAGTVRPDVITLENVKEILRWGPLVAKRDKETGRVMKLDGSVAKPGERVPVHEQFLVPDPTRVGQTWKKFVAILRGMGYEVETRVLCAADYGVPTTRNRLFMVARCDGNPIQWPEPTHFKTPAKGQKRWRAAAECIDFNLPTKSIFERERPLAPATLRRVARGLKKFVLDSADPFIVPVTHTTSGDRVRNIRDPLPTITTAKGGELMVATPTLVQMGYGEAKGQAPRALDLQQPLGTVVGGGNKFGLVTAFVEQANSGFFEGEGRRADRPLSTICGRGTQQRLITASLAHLRGNCDARDITEPVRTISAGGEHHALVEYHLSPEAEAGALRCAAFLMEYYGEGGQWSDLRQPMNTVTTRDRMALVTVWIKGDPYVVVDICLRMLTPRELANAMSFPPQYVLSHGADGRIFTKSQQVHFIGNAVPPDLQYAVTAANYSDVPESTALRRVA